MERSRWNVLPRERFGLFSGPFFVKRSDVSEPDRLKKDQAHLYPVEYAPPHKAEAPLPELAA